MESKITLDGCIPGDEALLTQLFSLARSWHLCSLPAGSFLPWGPSFTCSNISSGSVSKKSTSCWGWTKFFTAECWTKMAVEMYPPSRLGSFVAYSATVIIQAPISMGFKISPSSPGETGTRRSKRFFICFVYSFGYYIGRLFGRFNPLFFH